MDKHFSCHDGCLTPAVAKRNENRKWVLLNLSEIHGMGMAEYISSIVIKDKTEFGIKYESQYGKGNLAPDDVLFDIVKYETENLDGKSGYILDGFPRNIEQANWAMRELDIDYVINIKLDESIAKDRMLKRKRSDDTEKSIASRFATYHKHTQPAIELLGIDIEVDGNQEYPELYHTINYMLRTDCGYTTMTLENVVNIGVKCCELVCIAGLFWYCIQR